jgi:Tol biopolymer transport system component
VRHAATTAENSSDTYMNVRPDAARTLLLACVIPFLIVTAARAQFGVPFARYRTFETSHFIVTHEVALEDYARRAAARAETAHALLMRAYGVTPRGKIRLVIVDQGDIFNGAATTTPTNRIIAFAHTPVEGDLFFADDPVELLIIHELAHVFHLDEARRGWRVLRGVFGRSELTFPHLFDGSFLIEGLATFYESRLTDSGRVRGARFSEMLRAWLLETNGPHIDEAESDPGSWPLDRHYVFGGLFLEHLANRYGVDTTPVWMARRAGSFRSVLSRGAGVGEALGGRSLTQEWNDWIDSERTEALRLRDRLRTSAPGLAETTRVCDVAHQTSFPRVSPDGSAVAFLSTDEGRQPLGLYVADLLTCRARRVIRVDSAHAFAWMPDGRSIVLSQLTLVDNARWYADLFSVEVASGATTRLTRSARLTSPDVHPSGRTIVAVQYGKDRSRLVTVDLQSGTISPLTEFSTQTAWGAARWSPDGTRLAAVRFTRGASFDLVLLAPDGRLLQTLTDDRGLEGVPEWDPDAPAGLHRLFFTSDRTGLRELYGVELEGDADPRLYLVARVPTGLHEVAVVPMLQATSDARQRGSVPDRTAIVATVTHADGRHLERLEIDRAAWVTAPAPAAQFAQRAASPETSLALIDPTAPRAYSPARDLVPTGWSPVFESVGELGAFAGVATGGVDVIGRHAWQGRAAYGPDGRAIGSASYVYRRFPRAHLFGQVASTWRLEQRVESEAGELVRLERKRSAAVGVVFPWETLRRLTLFSANLEVEDRHRENDGDAAARAAAGPIEQDPTLIGGALGMSFGNAQAGLRSISAQDGVRMSASVDYLRATADDRWRSGWEVASSAYRSFPSWTTSGRPVLALTARIAEQRGPAAGRLTAGGVGTTSVLEGGGTNFEVRGYPPGFVAASALWSARTEMRLPIARVSRGLGALPLYLRGLSGSWFIDSVGAASRVDRLGAPQLLSTGGEVASDIDLFSFISIRIRTGVGVPLKSLGPISSGEARFYVTVGTSF